VQLPQGEQGRLDVVKDKCLDITSLREGKAIYIRINARTKVVPYLKKNYADLLKPELFIKHWQLRLKAA